jgi:hypothetical protein
MWKPYPECETFPPAQAFRLAQKLEPHFTPKHGSWLDIAEVELSALAAQCLGDRRIGDIDTLNTEVSAWDTQRNRKQKGVDWHFPTADARIKLTRLYPQIIEAFPKPQFWESNLKNRSFARLKA